MNEGLQITGRSGKPETLPKTDFYVGCAVSPFKRVRTRVAAAILQARPQNRRRRSGSFRNSATTCGSSTR